MKLYKITKFPEQDQEFYFSTQTKLAKYLNVTQSSVFHALKTKYHIIKGWIVTEEDRGDILSKYINPEN